MRSILGVPILLMCLAAPSHATAIADTYTPATPQQILIQFGTTTLADGLTLPAFNFSFFFGFSLNPSNYPGQATFLMDDSSLNPGQPASPPAITGISAPSLTPTCPVSTCLGDKLTTWSFALHSANSFMRVGTGGGDVLISIEYDPPISSAIFTLDPVNPLPTTPTPTPTTVKDNNGASGTTTSTVSSVPEPASLGILAVGLMMLAGKSWQRGKRA